MSKEHITAALTAYLRPPRPGIDGAGIDELRATVTRQAWQIAALTGQLQTQKAKSRQLAEDLAAVLSVIDGAIETRRVLTLTDRGDAADGNGVFTNGVPEDDPEEWCAG
jgi:hypothetical protein